MIKLLQEFNINMAKQKFVKGQEITDLIGEFP